MIWPCAETLRVIEPQLPHSLISTQAFAFIKNFASVLPEAMSSYYLECRLAADSPQVDLLACVKASNGGREILREYTTTAGPSPRSPDCAVWNRVRDFCTRWAEPRSSLHRQVSHIWLEFDGEASLTKIPPPNLLLCLDPEYFEECNHRQHDEYITARQYRRVINASLEILLPHRASAMMKRNLFACFDTLPPDGCVIHTSVMLSRRPSLSKLNIALSKDHLLDYLRHLGWPGSLSQLETLLFTYCSFTNSMKFQLNLEDSISPRIDLEFHFDDCVAPLSSLHFLLDQLVENNLCTIEKREALLTWPGTFRQIFCGRSWPTRLYKWLDLKIVYHPERPLEAKGYLGFMPSSSIF
jgi:hypothetical protein